MLRLVTFNQFVLPEEIRVINTANYLLKLLAKLLDFLHPPKLTDPKFSFRRNRRRLTK